MAAALASMNASGPPPEALPDTRREARDVRPAHISIDRPDTAHERGRGIDLRAIDGDTVEIRMTRERVRLANIDTPESGDRARCSAERVAAETATRAIASLIGEARTVKVTRTGRVDAYGRTIGAVLVDGRDLGRLMIEAGHARPWRGRREPWCAQSGALLR